MSHNTWLHRIARLGVKPLVNTPVQPNHITTLRLLAGLYAAYSFAVGDERALIVGAWVFVVSMLLDRADGDLARISGKTSRFGHRYDLVSDSVCNALIFVGLGIGLRESDLGLAAIAMGCLAGAAVAAILWLVIRIESIDGERGAEITGVAGFDPDDAMLAIPIAVLLGWAQGLLIAAAIGAPIFCVLMFVVFRKKLRTDD